jgi:hypothetical protein
VTVPTFINVILLRADGSPPAAGEGREVRLKVAHIVRYKPGSKGTIFIMSDKTWARTTAPIADVDAALGTKERPLDGS